MWPRAGITLSGSSARSELTAWVGKELVCGYLVDVCPRESQGGGDQEQDGGVSPASGL